LVRKKINIFTISRVTKISDIRIYDRDYGYLILSSEDKNAAIFESSCETPVS